MERHEENFHDWLVKERVDDLHAGDIKAREKGPRVALYRSIHKDRKEEEPKLGLRVKNKPAVPLRSESVPRVVKPKQNFVTANAVVAILNGEEAKRAPKPRRYVNKRSYAKVPKYLARVKEEIVNEYELVNKDLRQREREEELAKGLERELDEDERSTLIEKLKNRWDELNKQYQRQAHCVALDSIGKVVRKEKLELQLNKIEKAIDLLEKPLVICSSGNP